MVLKILGAINAFLLGFAIGQSDLTGVLISGTGLAICIYGVNKQITNNDGVK